MGKSDVIFSDSLNHASIIDGCRMSGAKTEIYPHGDMNILEKLLKKHSEARIKMIITDGVFSMEGDIAPISHIVDLAQRYDAVTIVDESHAIGVLGKRGSGSVEHYNMENKIDAVTGTFGKALGGGGGYVAGSRSLIDFLYNTSRSFLFTNALTPPTIATALGALELLESDQGIQKKLYENIRFFKNGITQIGLDLLSSESAIIPIMTYSTQKTKEMTQGLFNQGVYMHGVGYPVVPEGKARIRVQISAAHERAHLEKALDALKKVARDIGLIE